VLTDILPKYDYLATSRTPIGGSDPANPGILLAISRSSQSPNSHASYSLEVYPLGIIPATL